MIKYDIRYMRCFYKDSNDYFSRDYTLPCSEGLSEKGFAMYAEKFSNNDKDLIAYIIITKHLSI